MLNISTLAGIISTVALAVAGYLATTSQTLSQRIDQVDVSNAKVQQQVNDIDVRTTRIEDKLDRLLQKKVSQL